MGGLLEGLGLSQFLLETLSARARLLQKPPGCTTTPSRHRAGLPCAEAKADRPGSVVTREGRAEPRLLAPNRFLKALASARPEQAER